MADLSTNRPNRPQTAADTGHASGLSEPGWPRPRRDDGLPIPWVSPIAYLGRTDADRRRATIADKICQVCGIPHDRHGGDVVVFVAGPPIAKILHLRCARLAMGRCPRLRDLRRDGKLFTFVADVAAIVTVEKDPADLIVDSAGGDEDPMTEFVALDGAHPSMRRLEV